MDSRVQVARQKVDSSYVKIAPSLSNPGEQNGEESESIPWILEPETVFQLGSTSVDRQNNRRIFRKKRIFLQKQKEK